MLYTYTFVIYIKNILHTYIHIQRTFTYDTHIITISDSHFNSKQSGKCCRGTFLYKPVSNKRLRTTYIQQSLQRCAAKGTLQKVHL